MGAAWSVLFAVPGEDGVYDPFSMENSVILNTYMFSLIKTKE
jgi:hypothetical protein